MIKLVRRGRTQLSVQITDTHFDQLQAIKEETGLSNAKIIEMLIESYSNTNTTNTNNTKYVTEERVKELIQEALSSTQPEPEAPKKKLITMTPEEIEASCSTIDVSPPLPEWDEQAWLDEDMLKFSDDPNPPEIIRPKTAILDEDDDW